MYFTVIQSTTMGELNVYTELVYPSSRIDHSISSINKQTEFEWIAPDIEAKHDKHITSNIPLNNLAFQTKQPHWHLTFVTITSSNPSGLYHNVRPTELHMMNKNQYFPHGKLYHGVKLPISTDL